MPSAGPSGGPVHVVAVGARCPVGLAAEPAAAAIRAGISRVAEHPFMLDGLGEPVRCGRDPRLDPGLVGPGRLAALTEAAAGEVLGKLAPVLPSAVPLLLGLPESRPGFASGDALAVKQILAGRRLPGLGTVTTDGIGEGHASALSALRLAAERLVRGPDDLILVGGADSYLQADTLDWLQGDRRLARADVRSGFLPGEAAAVLALASEEGRRRLRLPVLATVRGAGCAQERQPPPASGSLGHGLAEAIVQATRTLRPPQEVVDDVYADVNAERDRAEEWGFALLRTPGRFRDGTTYLTVAAECGDVGAASGALGCVLAVQAWARGYAQGPRALVWGSSWGGLRAAILLERPSA